MSQSPFTADIPRLGEVRQAKSSPKWGAPPFWADGILPSMGNNLKSLRNKREWTHQEAADALGVSRGQFIKLERGERPIGPYRLRAAKVFGVTPAEISPPAPIPVWGLIGAGGAIDTEWEQQSEPLFEIETSVLIEDEAVGFKISGDSMWPTYENGDVIVVAREGEPISGLINQDAAVRVAGGGRYFKRLQPGSEAGLFDLHSFNAPTMRNVPVAWASGLIARIPASRWRRMNGKLK